MSTKTFSGGELKFIALGGNIYMEVKLKYTFKCFTLLIYIDLFHILSIKRIFLENN